MAFNRRGRRPMPVGGNTQMDNSMSRRNVGNSRFAPRGPQGMSNNVMPKKMGNRPMGNQPMPRFSKPLNQRNQMGPGQNMQQNRNFNRQKPYAVNPGTQDNTTFGGQGQNNTFENQGPRFSPTGVGQGRRPQGLPNVQMRKPGSGGSRVMNTPSVGRRNNFMRPNQKNQQNNFLGRRRNNNQNNNSGY